MNFTGGQPQIVIVTYRDILEDWTLNVFETDAVKITSADGWVNVAWLYGEGLKAKTTASKYVRQPLKSGRK